MIRFLNICFFIYCTSIAFSQVHAHQGKDYAVFFAVSDFSPGWNALPETIKEADQIRTELELNYGFICETLNNPTKSEIVNKLKDYNNRLSENDQILFFFSMHGFYDDSNKRGYLIAKDGRLDDREYGETWLDYTELDKILSRSKSKHILLALDACHSGSFGMRTKGRPTKLPDAEADCNYLVKQAMMSKGRQFCASGNQDTKTPANSKFAARFLETLKLLDQDEVLYFDDLASQLLRISNPRPVSGTFMGHASGPGFVFVRNGSCVPVEEELPDDPEEALWNNVLSKNTPADFDYYLKMYPNGKYKKIAVAEREWLKTVSINTCVGYRNYLTVFKRHRKEIEGKCPGSNMEKRSIGSIADNMVFVKGGTFPMGDADGEEDEAPVNQVTVSGFLIGKYEVTQAEWRLVMGKNPPDLEFAGCDQCPVENVSWENIQVFIRKLSKQTGHQYRLPTEAEWEFAARGGIYLEKGKTDNIDEIAWHFNNSGGKTHPVGSKKPNQLGLYDMNGNVYEWCNDYYGRYTSSPKTNPKGTSYSSARVCRGGSWGDGKSFIRETNRGNGYPEDKTKYVGFRLARSVKN